MAGCARPCASVCVIVCVPVCVPVYIVLVCARVRAVGLCVC